MKSAVLATAIVLLLANAVMYPAWKSLEEGGLEEVPEGVDIVPIDSISVQVPPVKAGDMLEYDYEFFGEIYDMNKTSGNWSRITLEANGQLGEQLSGSQSVRDGFHQPHDCWQLHTRITLGMKITIEEYSPGEENEPLILTGSINVDRDRFGTLRGDVPIVTYVGGLLGVDEIKGIDIPLPSNLTFSVDAWSYPDPSAEVERTLEERLYSNQATLEEGMNGTYWESGWEGFGEYMLPYNWSIDASERVRDWDCVKLNITLDFGWGLYLSKLLWLSNDVSRPVRVVYNSSTFWNEENGTGHIILETSQTLQSGGYQMGGSVIPIEPSLKEGFVDRHPSGIYERWEFVPNDGYLGGTSFDFGLEEALDYGLENVEELKEWIRTHPSPIMTESYFHANQTDQRTTDYIWNFTLADEPGNWSTWESWYETNAYNIEITKRVERRLVGDDIVTHLISDGHGPDGGYAQVAENDLARDLVTLASSERIWSQISEVANKAYGSSIEREVDFTEARYFLELGGVSPGGFGLDLLDTLTGVSFPTSNYTWVLQVGNVWEGATTYMVAVDAETGRMVFISDIEGPQALSLLFG